MVKIYVVTKAVEGGCCDLDGRYPEVRQHIEEYFRLKASNP